jgi:hypothetical protein
MPSKINELTTQQAISVNQFWKAVKEKKPHLKEVSKNNLSFLKSPDNQAIICDYLFSNDFSNNTLSCRFNDLGVILRNYLKCNSDLYIEYAIKFKDKYIEKERNEDHELGFKHKNYISYEFLKSRMKEFQDKVLTDKSRATHMAKLCIELNVLQAPLRVQLPTLEIVYDKKNMDDKTKNYLLIDGSDMYYVINNDKISNKIDASPIKLNSEATKCIKESLELFPRSYLLTNPTDENQCHKCTYTTTYLQKILFPDFPFMCQNIFRRAYATEYLKNASKISSEKLAKDMRTSEDMLRTIYNYRNADNNELLENDKIIKTTHTIQILNPNKSDKQFDMKEWSKNYRETNKETLQAKNKTYYEENKISFLRKKIIKNLNSGLVKQPTEESIKKYDLKKNSNNVWY